MEQLRTIDDPLEIYKAVLRSLESHRPGKAERDILDDVRDHFALTKDERGWPEELVKRCEPEAFLGYVLDRLSPFVEMVIELYDFLHHYASTMGGKTQHFKLEIGGASWPFDVSKMPREVQWIAEWATVDIEEVTVDWEEIGKSLNSDNGIFYATVDNWRVIQSLIIARRDGTLSPQLREIGDRIFESITVALRAWHRTYAKHTNIAAAFQVFVPRLADLLRQSSPGAREGYRVAVDPASIMRGRRGGWTLETLFSLPARERERDYEPPGFERGWLLDSALMFCALWILDEPSFHRVAGLLTAHEGRHDLLQGSDLLYEGPRLAEMVLTTLRAAILPTGVVTSAREHSRKRLEILLLPYWKDRWYLFELWTLVVTLGLLQDSGTELALEGLSSLDGGTELVWQLATQKAREPVARLWSGDRALSVWFQRETKRVDSNKNMEPDIRLTLDGQSNADLAIVECKDRIKFAGAKSYKVMRSYVDGSLAPLVWLVNYEIDDTVVETGVYNNRAFGIANCFRPGGVPQVFRDGMTEVAARALNLSGASAGAICLVIDVSGSMDGKVLPDDALPFLRERPECAYVWSATVTEAKGTALRALLDTRSIVGTGQEDAISLERFVRGLDQGMHLVVVTDGSGKQRLEAILNRSDEAAYPYIIAGRSARIIET